MKKNFFQLCAAVTLTAVMFSACSKQSSDEAVAPPAKDGKATVDYQIQAVNPTGSVAGDAAGTERLGRILNDQSLASFPSLRFDFTWDSIKVRFRELKFAAKSGPDEINLSVKSDRFIDILDSTELGSIMLPLGNFEQVKVYVRVQGDTVKPALLMNGRITFRGTDIPVEVMVVGKIELTATGKDVSIGTDGITFDGKLKLDLNLVMTKLQIGDFTGTFTGGKLVLKIDADLDTNNKLKSALETSMTVEHTPR
ncbi:hypothetical protein [Chitinophaga filiformis]|uniref:Auto-transporter adhesin, head GIN domain n=1 Tax=Chitinophaga filiformis TaxID=104663 RepID=A0ABY4IBC1_CHIFI|nr:hypothetical protein [Chitinophaga filiformis]UPK72509.1 hypothetical protein MYF79_14550 [Chitinophaga filiformis]